jgi:SP family general alpha glucoside:H+ symporter-like MFS transporter
MCWGAGILLSSGVVRAVAGLQGNMGWRLPFILQWVWPPPIFIGTYFAPESPWNAVRRGKNELARNSLLRLRQDTPESEREIAATLANIRHTTELEMSETANAGFFECFRGTNLWRTEIVGIPGPVVDTRLTSYCVGAEYRRLGRPGPLR